MADKEIKVSFPEAKVEALEFFLQEKDEKIEPLIKEHMDKLYEKYVPPQVRKFVEAKAGITNDSQVQQSSTEQQAPRQQNRRGSGRTSNQREDNTRQNEEVVVEAETVEEQSTEAEVAGMTMGM